MISIKHSSEVTDPLTRTLSWKQPSLLILKKFYLQSFPAFLVLIAGTEAIKEARIGNASSSTRHLVATSMITLNICLKKILNILLLIIYVVAQNLRIRPLTNWQTRWILINNTFKIFTKNEGRKDKKSGTWSASPRWLTSEKAISMSPVPLATWHTCSTKRCRLWRFKLAN